ncbi:TrkA family potassium uptake protein [Halorussus sp. MSC15.2]|uniref:potassium channel family protein n=1 Tax=Halorussus sp. MSC15.2 TaxID=2283638 RepID=UPI0013D21AC5|nr:NAD-binding protein [Halorussus sp. MSC15.2]NEU58151.1 TrkA family potassium uptake protein [Halorussus sp. MSC15.2]
METWKRRTLYYVSTLVAVFVGYALIYDYGMAVHEGHTQPFYQSMQVVVETFTTTGYGSDAPWETPEMNLFVMLMDLTGVVLIFAALPVFVVPLFEDALSTTLPTSVEDLEDHVVICTHTPRAETLISELESWDVEYVVVEPDRETALDLYESDYSVIHGDPESVETLENANLDAATALVADAGDEVDVSIVLTAREAAEDVRIVSVVEEPDHEAYHELAGVDEVLSPRRLVGESLADKITTAVSTELGDVVEIGSDFEIAELSVQRGSELVGHTLAESGIRERSGANVIGAWTRGEFETPPSPETELAAGTVLLVAGRQAQLERLNDLASSTARSPRRGTVLVVGHGEVGSTVTDALAAANISYTVVDVADKPGVDVQGDTTNPETLEQAGIEQARTVVFTVADDTLTGFGTLVARDLNPDIEVLARAEETGNVKKLYRAGADYVLALATVSGRMLASTILEREEVISMDKQVEIVRTTATEFVGQSLAETDIRARTGCTVVAVERDGSVVTELGPDFHFRRGDDVIVAGTDESVGRFTTLAN